MTVHFKTGIIKSVLAGSLLTVLALPGAATANPVATTPEAKTVAPTTPVMLPDRLLDCDLGLALNLDPNRDQKRSDVHYEGHHPFRLFLPGIPVRTAPPPDPIDPAEPVDPRTRIVADPDKLTDGVPNRFDRVVDYWPGRVEMATTLPNNLFYLIIVSDIDLARGTATLFMTHAADVAALDLKHVYSGQCRITYHQI